MQHKDIIRISIRITNISIASKQFLIRIHRHTLLTFIALNNLHIRILIRWIEHNFPVYMFKHVKTCKQRNFGTLKRIFKFHPYKKKIVLEVNIVKSVFVHYALINFRSLNKYAISIELLSVRISIKVTNISWLSKQSKA